MLNPVGPRTHRAQRTYGLSLLHTKNVIPAKANKNSRSGSEISRNPTKRRRVLHSRCNGNSNQTYVFMII